MERELIAAQLPMVDLLIRPKVAASYSFDFRGIDELLEAGRRAATAALPDLRQLLHPTSSGE